MPLAPVVATQLTDRAARYYGLYIDGLDVSADRVPGNGYAVDTESVEIIEAQAGQVSSMRFTIGDPLNEITVADGARVTFVNLNKDVTEFAGWVDTATMRTVGIGREIEVSCIGIEAVLDWLVVGSVTIAQGTPFTDAMQQILSAAAGIGFGLSWGQGTTYDAGIQSPAGISPKRDVTITGQTVRQAFEAVAAASLDDFPPPGWIALTVTYGGVVLLKGVFTAATIFGTAQQVVSTSGPVYPANHEYSPIQGDSTRAVYVVGGNAAGTGLVPDGTGIPGQTAIVNEPGATTEQLKRAAAYAVMGRNGEFGAGTFTLENYTQTATRDAAKRVWSQWIVTDSVYGLSSVTVNVLRIVKRFHKGGTETWTLTYGNRLRSAARQIRVLTRTTVA